MEEECFEKVVLPFLASEDIKIDSLAEIGNLTDDKHQIVFDYIIQYLVLDHYEYNRVSQSLDILYSLFSNPSITINVLKRFPKNLYKLYSSNPCLTPEILTANPDWEIEPKLILTNPSFSSYEVLSKIIPDDNQDRELIHELSGEFVDIEFIKKHMFMLYEYNSIELNPHITHEILEEYTGTTIDYNNFIKCNKNFSLEKHDASKFPKSFNVFHYYSFNKYLTFEIFQKYKNEKWNYKELSNLGVIPWSYIKKNLNNSWKFESILRVNTLTPDDFIYIVKNHILICEYSILTFLNHLFVNPSFSIDQIRQICETEFMQKLINSSDDCKITVKGFIREYALNNEYYHFNFFKDHKYRLSKAKERLDIYHKELIKKSCKPSRVMSWNEDAAEDYPELYREKCKYWRNLKIINPYMRIFPKIIYPTNKPPSAISEMFYKEIIVPFYKFYYSKDRSKDDKWKFYKLTFDNSISSNSATTWELVCAHPEIDWNIDGLSSNISIPWEVMIKNRNLDWSFYSAMLKRDLTIDIILAFPLELQSILKFSYNIIDWRIVDLPIFHIKNTDFISQIATPELYLKNPELPWNYVELSRNENFTYEFIKQHPDKPWNYNVMLNRCTWKEIQEFQHEFPDFISKEYLIMEAKDFGPKLAKEFNIINRFELNNSTKYLRPFTWKFIKENPGNFWGDHIQYWVENNTFTADDLLDMLTEHPFERKYDTKTYFECILKEVSSIPLEDFYRISESQNIFKEDNKIMVILSFVSNDYYYYNFMEDIPERLSSAKSRLDIYRNELLSTVKKIE